jgi:hypothetical protein
MLKDILANAAMEEQKKGNTIDAILLIGDLVCHGLAADPASNTTTYWTL